METKIKTVQCHLCLGSGHRNMNVCVRCGGYGSFSASSKIKNLFEPTIRDKKQAKIEGYTL